MGRKLTGKRPKPATLRQRRWRKKAERERKHGDAIAHRAEVFERLAAATEEEEARLGTKLYELLYVDPPWDEPAWSEAGEGRSARNTYMTTPLEALKATTPPAAATSSMFMWTTSTYLGWAMELLKAWGFDYGGYLTWNKQIIGKGRRFRLQSELILVGHKGGGLKPPAPRDRISNHFSIRAIRRKGGHSGKPPEIAAMLVQQYPKVSRVEMFARVPSGPDWDVWGNEAGSSPPFGNA